MNNTKVAVALCGWMNQVNYKNQEENKVIQYGLELLLDNIIKIFFIQLIGIFIGKGLETLIILSSFCGLRMQAGGIHAKTGWGCGFSMLLIWAISILGNIFFEIRTFYLLYIYILSLLAIVIFVPRTINIEFLSKQDIFKKKICSFAILTFIMVIAFLNSSLRGLLLYPVILEVLTLFPKNKRSNFTLQEEIN